MVDADDSRPPIRVLLAIGNPERERRLRDALSAEGLVVAERCLDGPSLAERAQAFDVDVALASADLHRLSPATLLAIREARLPLVLLAEPGDIEKHTGLAHFVPSGCSGQEVTDALRQAVQRGAVYGATPAVAAGRGAEEEGIGGGSGARGRLITLLSGKGAPGVTTVTIGLAAALSERGRRVVLVDADLRGGNVGPYLDLDPRRGLVGLAFGRDGASATGPVEEELQEGPGFMVLAGVERPHSGLSVSAEMLTAALTTLRETFDDVLVDVGEVVACASSPADGVLRAADRQLVVVGADLVALWNARCVLRYLRDGLGVAPDAMGVVLNRREGRGQYAAEEVGRALELPVVAVLPEDRRAVRRAVAEQVPITAAGGPVGRQVRRLAALVAAETVTRERAVTRRPRRFPFGLRAARRS